MHFSKTYTELLLSLPPELRENAIQYRQLKKVIKQITQELTSLGLSPSHLNELLQPNNGKGKAKDNGSHGNDGTTEQVFETKTSEAGRTTKCVYEIVTMSDSLQPRLRLWIADTDRETAESLLIYDKELNRDSDPSLTSDVLEVVAADGGAVSESKIETVEEDEDQMGIPESGPSTSAAAKTSPSREVVIPLNADRIFFDLLLTALHSFSVHLQALESQFLSSLQDLARSITASARPFSSTNAFHAHSQTSDPTAVHVPSITHAFKKVGGFKSDLYAWREFFQIYVEAEIFESTSERSRGERTIEDAEERLRKFVERIKEGGFQDKKKWRLKESREAFRMFMQLNQLLLDLKKLQYANAEATRKILKKHAKRTALPLLPLSSLAPESGPVVLAPSPLGSPAHPHISQSDFLYGSASSLPRVLVQAIGETLLPIVPHVDDYACLICTGIAFKPIRLRCSHLFCVRCLVKMQKRGKANCPICRAPTVLVADRSNVDWALLNFMKDWFPVESKAKLLQNEREASQEELEELGLDVKGCVIA
ncbi:hypothetical protein GLOTRDRAFT_140984 [Gloeophyllum trabeum ATCC 11539]|uniref:RING-14 protein n=1 Tax=Gloeophyllum trabeum (strain ATCC 11539 / FP-39264 / Madison 617) TaxID=670483 RepID=S7RBI9_GLOTA|nr:uncharacterized protein GLOTRDRAFT_140984 [Gloeophyllum trabeum ATCC 11539]EPQ51605.1 hypothetical protein GLOTRDRAFT_140984 [Gloeophyllum trabeum ATCC 11539]